MARWDKRIICNVHFFPPREDLVFIAGNFKPLSRLLHAHNGYIGQPDLIGWREDGSRHRCRTQGRYVYKLSTPVVSGTRATDRHLFAIAQRNKLEGIPL